jgi:hypothetical protein
MITLLRKGSSLIYVHYKTGNYTNNLAGANFSLHESDSELNFEIDLSGNYKARSTDTNSYADVTELSETHEGLTTSR